MIKITFLLLITSLLPNISNAATCKGKEGAARSPWFTEWNKEGLPKKGVREEWSFDASRNLRSGDDFRLLAPPKLSGKILVVLTESTFSAEKKDMADGNNCTYAGDIITPAHDLTGTLEFSIVGRYNCPNGGPYEFKMECITR